MISPALLGAFGGLRQRASEFSELLLVTLSGCVLVGISVALIRFNDPGGVFVPVFWRLLRDDVDAALPLCSAGLLGSLSAMLLSGRRPRLSWLADHPRTMAVGAMLVALLLSTLSYQRQPLAMDEVAPLFQARVFAMGRLAAQFDPSQLPWLFAPDFLGAFFFVEESTGRVVSAYWPGMALLLTPFELLGAGFALNPVLAGVSVPLIRHIALRITDGDRDACGAVMALLLAAPAFFINAASFYSMNAHLCANLAFVALLLHPTPARLIAAGAVGGFAFSLHNPLPHLLFAWPWWCLVLTGGDRVRRAILLLSGYVAVAGVLVVGWFMFSESLRGPGVSIVGGSALSTPSSQVFLTRLLGMAKLVLWSPIALLPLAALGFMRRGSNRVVRCLGWSALSTLLGYLVVRFDQGHGWGYRYFHPAYATLPLLAGAALASPAGAVARAGLFRAALGWGVAGLVIVLPQRALQVGAFVSSHRAQLIGTPSDQECVHFIWPGGSHSVDLVANDPALRGDLYLSDRGSEAVAALRGHHFPATRLHGKSGTDAAYCGELDSYRSMALGERRTPE